MWVSLNVSEAGVLLQRLFGRPVNGRPNLIEVSDQPLVVAVFSSCFLHKRSDPLESGMLIR